MKVAIIGAMEEEVTILRDKLEGLEQVTIAGSGVQYRHTEWYRGHFT
ncbi:hypothetical protein KEH51_16715 [[Brevibacterium] frigoritolerans]|uniref:5'-methylthioadenosine/S-adenosylhomocysteine nucleosidase n=1 Tax=Peribacillus frigoritolerans TaxID=450367 RepID=A0A941JAZ9_9BACI|nr:hypothetical protein [Peribacillus frigoritolerans]